MAATDGQIILAASRFGDSQPVYLRDFATKPNQLPAIAKIVKGQHLNLGVPTLSNPSLQSTALFLNAGKKYQILAQPIKIKEGRKPTNVGTKVLIPETYPGYFELLSEDGRSTRCIDSALELSKRRNLRVLVRETFRCNHMNKTIHAGEILTTIQDNGKILQCKNLKDEIINLPLETKAKFSPVAKEDSISGVHTVKNLLLKRMPVIVRLVHGSAPKGLKQPFIPELRLLGCVEVDRVFALPLQKDMDLVPVPLNAKIKLQRAKNMEQLEHFIEYTRFFDKAQRLLIDARDRLQIVDIKLSEKEKKESKSGQNRVGKLPLMVTSLSSINGGSGGVENVGYVLRKSASCDSYSSKHLNATTIGTSTSGSSNSQNQSINAIADEYNEIDHIYDYVRGLTPLSKGLTRIEPINESQIKYQQQQNVDGGNYSSLKRVSHNNSSSSNINNNYNSLESIKQVNSHHHHHHHHHQHQHNNNQQQQHNNNQSATTTTTGIHHSEHRILHNIQPHFNNHSHIRDDLSKPPVPPPIETIPGKKLAEKRQRPTLPKLYVKNNNSSSQSINNNNSLSSNNNNNNNNININNNSSSSNNNNNNSSHHTKIITNNCNGGFISNNHHQHSSSNSSCNNGGGISPVNALNVINGNKDCLEPQSPLFHIRYKSLSSLQLTPPDSNSTTPISITPKGHDVKINQLSKSASTGNHHQVLVIGNGLSSAAAAAVVAVNNSNHNNHNYNGNTTNCNGVREGTLDSSRSGGRTSGDSNKLPEKKTRRLSRPRSLSNLVWDLRPSKDKTKKKLYIHHFEHRQQGTLYL